MKQKNLVAIKKSKALATNILNQHKTGTKAHLIRDQLVYGGALQHRKFARPFLKNRCTHVILRSRLLSGSRSLLKSNRKEWVQNLIQKKAKKYNSKLYQFSINSNHLHLLIKFTSDKAQADFLRDLAGSLALKIKRTFKIAKTIRIWDERPFSSVVKTKTFKIINNYILKNKNEAAGLWPYQKRPVSNILKVLAKLNGTKSLKISPAETSLTEKFLVKKFLIE